ncbi:response regulator transcription factor [Pseudoalteromonas sp. CnMc7-15]|uniref:response regulator n=1 Tax=unclassified Pseudoalteromonas TaxID=194690 RepID=UPI001EF64AB9|nr:response regulator transcription factor [Pseudoalteromonas sp. CnMc7-15]MCG7566879.1 response regulator transcription factor [Pseudoalteromonas sp. CnMc7-15]
MQQSPHILVVEDDLSLSEWMQDFLSQNGYQVGCCGNGKEVEGYVQSHHPDLVLLDVMLPGMDGISVCTRLRQFYQQPIIMLTARDNELDEVIGLEVGASDYIAKPVRPRVLLARIKAALRPGSDEQPPKKERESIQVGGLRIDTEARRVSFNNNEVALSNAEFALLCYLAQHAGEVVDRDSVFRAVKGREYDGLDRSIDVVVSALRKHFNDNGNKPQRIKTIWGKGYLLVKDAWS